MKLNTYFLYNLIKLFNYDNAFQEFNEKQQDNIMNNLFID
jgi:hypothetical protein